MSTARSTLIGVAAFTLTTLTILATPRSPAPPPSPDFQGETR